MNDNEVKIYTSRDISLATVIGSPLLTGYLLYKNYKIFGDEKAAMRSLNIGIFVTTILFIVLFYIPIRIIDIIPNQLIPLINGGIASLIVEKLQGQRIKDHIDRGGKKESVWKVIGISLIGTVASVILIIPFLFFQASFDGEVMDFNDGKHKIFYEENIPTSDINKIGICLLETGLFSGDNQIEIDVRKIKDGYNLYVPINEEYWTNLDVIRDLKNIRKYIEDRLLYKTIYIIMVHYDTFSFKEKELE